MVATIPFNPYLVSNAPGSFNVESDGFVQGCALDDPSARYRLRGGVLSDAETIPMWGGVGISETTNPNSGGPAGGQTGGLITRATTQTAAAVGQLTGFSVFDQNYSAVISPQSPVPLVASGGQVNFYPLGSLARIPVACDPALVSAEGKVITQQVAWDFVNQRLVPYLGTLTISSGTYNNTTGEVVLTMSAPITFGEGDAIIVSGLTGTGAYAGLDGTFTAEAGSAGTTVKYNARAGVGAATITGGSLTLGSGASSALPVKVLQIDAGNSMVVSRDADTGFVTWDRSGTVAVIQI